VLLAAGDEEAMRRRVRRAHHRLQIELRHVAEVQEALSEDDRPALQAESAARL
jgi:hypothetical protein